MKCANHLSTFVLLFACVFFPCTPLLAAQMMENSTQATELRGNATQETGADVNMKHFLPMMEEATKAIENVRGKELVLFLGPTGAGKSTTINYLLGHEMRQEKKEIKGKFGRKRVEQYISFVPDANLPGASIGIGNQSATRYPTCYTRPYSKLVYCDCPGFFDTRGEEHRICVSLAITQAIQQSAGVKALVFCMGMAELKAARGKIFTDMIQIIDQMFKEDADPKEHIRSIFILFTKELEHTIDDYLDKAEATYEAIGSANQANPKLQLMKAQFLLKEILEHHGNSSTNTKRLFSVNPLDPSSKRAIITALEHSQTISKEKFGFVSTRDMRRNCSSLFVKPFIKESAEILEDILDYTSRKARLEQAIEDYESTISSLEEAETHSTRQGSSTAIQGFIDKCKVRQVESKKQVASLEAKNNQLNQKILENNTDLFVLQEPEPGYNEYRATWGFGACFKTKRVRNESNVFKYKGHPFVGEPLLSKEKEKREKVKEESEASWRKYVITYLKSKLVMKYEKDDDDYPEGGKFEIRHLDNAAGEYTIAYTPPLEALGRARVRIYVEKRFLYKDSIQHWQKRLEKNNGYINRLWVRLGMSTSSREDVKEMVECEKREKKEYQAELSMLNKQCQKARQRENACQCAYTVIPLLNLQEDEMAKTFTELYEAYKREFQSEATFVDQDDKKELDPSYLPMQHAFPMQVRSLNQENLPLLLSREDTENKPPTASTLSSPAQYAPQKNTTQPMNKLTESTILGMLGTLGSLLAGFHSKK